MGRTPLQLAIANGNLAAATALLKAGADVKHRNHHGETALHLAAKSGNRAALKLLLDDGADVDARDDLDTTPLFDALAAGSKACVDLLIERGAEIGATTAYGWTPLHLAAFLGNLEMIDALLERGADPDAEGDSSGTPLDMALVSENENAASVLRPRTRTRPHQAEIDLVKAIRKGDEVAFEDALSRNPGLNRFFLPGISFVGLASLAGEWAFVERLLQEGADPNVRDYDGETLFMSLIGRRIPRSIVRSLVDAGADVNAVSTDGSTALFKAVAVRPQGPGGNPASGGRGRACARPQGSHRPHGRRLAGSLQRELRRIPH